MKLAFIAMTALLASPAAAAERGWICHYEAPKNDLLRALGLGEMEKFEVRGNELVVSSEALSRLVDRDTAASWEWHYKIITNNAEGLVATMGSAEKGEVYAQTISISRARLGVATKTVTSTDSPKDNVILLGSCVSY
jgi:hypothetical protein